MPDKHYLAGPMTGYEDYNFPRFHEAARLLREAGFNIVNPAELDEEDPDREGKEYTDFMSRDLEIVLHETDGIIAIDKWWESKGARMEVFVGISMDKPVLHLSGDILTGLPKATCMRLIQEGMDE